MSATSDTAAPRLARGLGDFGTAGLFWLGVTLIAAAAFFHEGLDALLVAWQLPEYSHGPLIPVLSAFLFLRQLKQVPEQPGPMPDRWPGIAVIIAAMTFGTLGKLSNIDDLVAYSVILFIGGLILVSFGWSRGRQFWPPVLHLIYMLPLPGVLYYKLSTFLQFISSEIGVWMLQLISVPVFLEGNIIDLGVTKLHVAEACSGLRYLFPILSFSYIFAVLYRGSTWHKAVLLLAAVPITVLMNSVRIAIAGVGVNHYGLGFVEGFNHFFEGWVIFLACVVFLFGLARLLLIFNPVKMGLAEALDLDTSGFRAQMRRLRLVQPSPALVTAAALLCLGVLAWQAMPDRDSVSVQRESFATFPRQLRAWQQDGPAGVLSEDVARSLAATDYHDVTFRRAADEPAVSLFMAWYADQSKGGVHSPEICLPGGGWEIAWLERTDIAAEMGSARPFSINRAIIQKGEVRMMVYYWFEQKDRRIAWDFAAKFWLMMDGILTGRTDGALVRLTTPIRSGETESAAEARLKDMLIALQAPLPRFIPPSNP
jgi:exosortase D (VPLPA-CTERM-specific)